MITDEEFKNFVKENNKILKLELEKQGFIKDKRIIIIGTFVLGMLFCGIILYGIQSDSFKSVVNQDVNVVPNITNTINNTYDIPVLTENNNDYNIVLRPNYTINVNIPENICGNQ